MAPILWEFLTKFMAEMVAESLVFFARFCGVSLACSLMGVMPGIAMGIALLRLGFTRKMFCGAKGKTSVKGSLSMACLPSIGNHSF
jgi:hypothetical protein